MKAFNDSAIERAKRAYRRNWEEKQIAAQDRLMNLIRREQKEIDNINDNEQRDWE